MGSDEQQVMSYKKEFIASGILFFYDNDEFSPIHFQLDFRSCGIVRTVPVLVKYLVIVFGILVIKKKVVIE